MIQTLKEVSSRKLDLVYQSLSIVRVYLMSGKCLYKLIYLVKSIDGYSISLNIRRQYEFFTEMYKSTFFRPFFKVYNIIKSFLC